VVPCDHGAVAIDVGRWRTRVDRVTDPVIAVTVFGLSVLPLIRHDDCACPPAPAWAYALIALLAAPLVVRRRWPFSVSLVCGFATVAYGVTSQPDPPVAYAGLVALYTAAAHATRSRALAAGGIAACAIAFAVLVDADADYEDVLVAYLLFSTAWLLGMSVRNRRERAVELEERAAALERTREAEAQRAVVEERNRIARELHDVVAHHVSVIVVQAEAGPVAVARDPARAVETFDTISATGKLVLTEMRRLLGVLRTDETARLAPQPGADLVPDLVAGVRAAGLRVDLAVTGEPRELPPAVDLSVYRVLQEALTNALRHAGPATVQVRVDYGADAVRLDVVDDGAGAGAANGAMGSGNGLLAMRERIGLVGGEVTAGPRPDGGWAVHASLPLAADPARMGP
jgi:signal transduction histidine kinase